MTPQARMWWDAQVGAYRLASPFNRALVDALKTSIPVSDRSFDDKTKIWTLTERYAGPLEKLLKGLGVVMTVVWRAQAEAAAGSVTAAKSESLDAVLLRFVKLLPFDAAQSAYRKASLALHPDRGGSMEKMSQLNAAWQRIEKELFNQQ